MSNLRQGAPQKRTMGRKSAERIAMVGVTGLIGRRAITITSAGDEARIVGIARREMKMPEGARMEMFVADPENWGDVLETLKPRALICALGTTWKKAGRDETEFRKVDQELIVQTAQAAKDAGVLNMVLVSSAGADPMAKSLYLKVKGETETLVTKVGLKRLDILRPGLLRGSRSDDFRFAEKAAMMIAPLVEPILPAKYEMYHSIDADLVAEAALALSMRRAQGRFTHDNEGIKRAAREWRGRVQKEQED